MPEVLVRAAPLPGAPSCPRWLWGTFFAILLGVAGCRAAATGSDEGASGLATVTVARKDVVRTIRLHGVLEAINARPIVAPQLTGSTTTNQLTVTRLVANGTRIKLGELLVEFDRQQEINTALEKRAELLSLDADIAKKRAEQAEQLAKDQTELKAAENAVSTARLDVLKNDLLPPIEAEKNDNALAAASERFKQLKETFDLKRRAARAELQILEVRRERARAQFEHASANAERLSITAPLEGLVVLRTRWRQGQMTEMQEGDQLRPGVPVLDVVDPSAMRVRVRVNQADLAGLQPGQRATITLDAYPDRQYPATLSTLGPVGLASAMNDKVRTFVALVRLDNVDGRVAPDLSAAVDVGLERWPAAVAIPRAAIRAGERPGTWEVGVLRGGNPSWRVVQVKALTDVEAVIGTGLEPGERVLAAAPPREENAS
jgi:HlyD family secretion protein